MRLKKKCLNKLTYFTIALVMHSVVNVSVFYLNAEFANTLLFAYIFFRVQMQLRLLNERHFEIITLTLNS